MRVRAKISSLKESHWYEYLARFALGGLATVVAGFVAKTNGPEWGGLFLAFPAIFGASATLIEKHERQRKEKKGLKGSMRGKEAAALDAAGAVLGSFAMAAFALTVWFLAAMPYLALLSASISWLVIGLLAWRFRKALRIGALSAKYQQRQR
jgi:hypothetical protein